MIDLEKITKLLKTDTPQKKTSFRIDELTDKYRGKQLPYEYYKHSDFQFVLSRVKTIKTPHRLMAIAQIDSEDIIGELVDNYKLPPEVMEYIHLNTKSVLEVWRLIERNCFLKGNSFVFFY